MNLKSLLILTLALSLTLAAFAAEKVLAGPKGGRLLSAEPHAAEFFVTPDQKIEITFYDDALQAIARGEQTATVTAEAPGGRRRIELEPTAHGFVSRAPLPEGAPYRVVVQLRAKPETRLQNFRIDLNLSHCGGCDRAEYACTCEH